MFRFAAMANDDFLEKILKSLVISSKTDGIKFYMVDEAMLNSKKIVSQNISAKFEILQYNQYHKKNSSSALNKLFEKIFWAHTEASSSNFTQAGSFWTNDTAKPVKLSKSNNKSLSLKTKFKSIAIIPVLAGKNCAGILKIGSFSKDFFNTLNMEFLENSAQIILCRRLYLRHKAPIEDYLKPPLLPNRLG